MTKRCAPTKHDPHVSKKRSCRPTGALKTSMDVVNPLAWID